MHYKAVIFDLDGTLLNTLEDLAGSVNAVLKSKRLPEYPVNAYRFMVGDGIDHMVQQAFSALKPDAQELLALVDQVKTEYSQRWPEHTRPYPGVPDLLNYLAGKAIPCAILTNKPQEFASLTVATLLPQWDFLKVRGIQADVPKKPDPLGALQIAEEMRLPPSNIIYLGDTDTDMKTAKAGGFFPVGAVWGFRTAQELIENGAQLLLEKPLDLITLLEM